MGAESREGKTTLCSLLQCWRGDWGRVFRGEVKSHGYAACFSDWVPRQ